LDFNIASKYFFIQHGTFKIEKNIFFYFNVVGFVRVLWMGWKLLNLFWHFNNIRGKSKNL
jgi:hypothetical protein